MEKLLELEAKNSLSLKTLTLDLADEQSIERAADAFDAKKLDILINCGGKLHLSLRFLTLFMTLLCSEWGTCFQIIPLCEPCLFFLISRTPQKMNTEEPELAA